MKLAAPLKTVARAVGDVTKSYRWTTTYVAVVVTVLLVLELR